MAFLYSVLLKLLYPTSITLLLLAAGVALRRRPAARRVCNVLAVVVLLICGNGWVVSAMVRYLEAQHLPPESIPTADAILVLSGGVLGRTPPRQTVEIGDAGDRVLYGAELYRQGKAPHIICTGNVATGGIAPRPAAEDMADLLRLVGVPASAIVTEIKSENTRAHAVNLCPLLQERRINRVLLVTSAMHMPRSIGVFRRLCSAIEFVPAPTDFRAPFEAATPWHRQVVRLLPTPRSLLDFSDAAHEYVGIVYYRLRQWM